MGTSAGAGPVSLGLLAMLVLLLTCKWDEEQITNYKISNWQGLQHHTRDIKLHKTGEKISSVTGHPQVWIHRYTDKHRFTWEGSNDVWSDEYNSQTMVDTSLNIYCGTNNKIIKCPEFLFIYLFYKMYILQLPYINQNCIHLLS